MTGWVNIDRETKLSTEQKLLINNDGNKGESVEGGGETVKSFG